GALDNDRRMASADRLRRARDVHRPPSVVVVRWGSDPGRTRRGRFRHCSAGRADQCRTLTVGHAVTPAHSTWRPIDAAGERSDSGHELPWIDRLGKVYLKAARERARA